MTIKSNTFEGDVVDIEKFEIDRQKQEALAFLDDLWDQASDEGINIDCLSHAALFQAISGLVLAYGEDAVAEFFKGLPDRILCGDYTLGRKLQ